MIPGSEAASGCQAHSSAKSVTMKRRERARRLGGDSHRVAGEQEAVVAVGVDLDKLDPLHLAVGREPPRILERGRVVLEAGAEFAAVDEELVVAAAGEEVDDEPHRPRRRRAAGDVDQVRSLLEGHGKAPHAITYQRMQKKWQTVPASTKRCHTMCE